MPRQELQHTRSHYCKQAVTYETEVKRLEKEVTELTEKNTNAESNLNAKTEELHHTLSHYCKQAVTYEAEVKRLEKEVTELTEKSTNAESNLNAKTDELERTGKGGC